VCLEFHTFLKSFTSEAEAVAAVLAPRAGGAPPRVAPPSPAGAAPSLHDDNDDHASNAAVDDVLGGPRIVPMPAPASEKAPLARENGEAPRSADLDVASATQDRNVHQDDKLRTLGWHKYGQRLKKRADSGKLKDSGGSNIDPEDEHKP
jgi:hypothetical protein